MAKYSADEVNAYIEDVTGGDFALADPDAKNEFVQVVRKIAEWGIEAEREDPDGHQVDEYATAIHVIYGAHVVVTDD
jgi:hypothetical protein